MTSPLADAARRLARDLAAIDERHRAEVEAAFASWCEDTGRDEDADAFASFCDPDTVHWSGGDYSTDPIEGESW